VLRLRRGVVVASEPLTVEVAGERRPAWADRTLVGRPEVGDEVVVNVAALDLSLGSGGFDIVHANLTRGLDARPESETHVMKLNYSSLQHPVEPLELPDDVSATETPLSTPVAVIALHGHLAPLAWAAASARPGLRLGFVQAAGGALPGTLSRDVPELRARDLVHRHVTAGASHGGAEEAITAVGAIHALASADDVDAIVVGPGPGILGSATRYGHGGMAALDAAHAALALALPTLVAPRMSSSDPRARHRGLSHHSRTVLSMLLATVRVPVPEAGIEGWPLLEEGAPEGGSPQAALDDLIEVCGERHDIAVRSIDLAGYAESGLPRTTMGRTIEEDPLFFAAPLAAGDALAEAVAA